MSIIEFFTLFLDPQLVYLYFYIIGSLIFAGITRP